MAWLVLAATLVWWGGLAAVEGHPAFLTSAELTIEADGSFQGRAEFDILAFALNDTSARIGNEPMEQLLAGPEEALTAQLANAKSRFLHGFRVTTDTGPGVVESLTFPTSDEVIEWRDTRRPVLPVVIPVTMSGHLPKGAQSVEVRFPAVLEQVVLSVERPGEEAFLQPVEAGKESAPLPLQLAMANAVPKNLDRGKDGVRNDGGSGGAQIGSVGSWLAGGRFALAVGGLVGLSFAGAYGWSRLTAKP